MPDTSACRSGSGTPRCHLNRKGGDLAAHQGTAVPPLGDHGSVGLRRPAPRQRSPLTRVLYVQGAPDRAGAESVLIDRLRHLEAAGVQPAVAALADGSFARELGGLGVPVSVLASAPPRVREPWRLPHAVQQIAALARRLDIDVIDGWGEKMSVLAGWAGRVTRRPVVLSMHDAPRRSVPSTAVQLAALTGRHDTVVVPSRWMAEAYQAAWRLNAHVIPNGVAVGALPDTPAPIRADCVWPPDVPVIGIFGRLVGWKGQGTFLRAAGEIMARHPGARFLVVGGTLYGYEREYAGQLRRLAGELGLAERVRFTGHRTDQLALMLACDVVCHASVEPEPFGMVVAEAMALGRPVVATRTGGPEEMIRHGQTGLLTTPGDHCELADAVLSLLTDESRARQLGNTARSAAVHAFDAATVTVRVAELYDRLASRDTR